MIQRVTQKIDDKSILFFDLDGTLVDTDCANFLSYRKAIQKIAKIDIGMFYNFDKRINRSDLKNVISNLSDMECEKIIQEKERFYKNFLPETKLNKVIVELLLKYSETNKTVLVSNCRQNRALMILNYFGLTDKFNWIFCRQFSRNGEKINKYENAISCLNVSPNSIIVFENEKTEVSDAVNASIPNNNILIFKK